MTIHVHTQCDRSTIDYVQFMWKTMLKLASNPQSIFLNIHCIGPKAAQIANDLKMIRTNAINVSAAISGGSFGHAACIMSAFSMINNDEQCAHVICDSDAFVVAKGWDSYVKQRIIHDEIGMMGTTYENVGGFSSGTTNVQTYKKLPTFTWCALNPKHQWSTLDVMPNKELKILVSNDDLSKIYNLPIGHFVFGEAGYQLPKFIHDNNISCEGWLQLKPSKTAKVTSGLSDYHEEFHVNDTPFVVHHRGSLRHKYRESQLSIDFFAKVDPWIESEANLKPHWKY